MLRTFLTAPPAEVVFAVAMLLLLELSMLLLELNMLELSLLVLRMLELSLLELALLFDVLALFADDVPEDEAAADFGDVVRSAPLTLSVGRGTFPETSQSPAVYCGHAGGVKLGVYAFFEIPVGLRVAH